MKRYGYIKEKMLETEEAARDYLATCQLLEAELIEVRDKAFNEIDQQIEQVENAKNEVGRLVHEVTREFEAIGSDIEMRREKVHRKLEDLRSGIADKILNGSENALKFALNIRAIADEENNRFLSNRGNLETTITTAAEKIRKMQDKGLIDIKTAAQCMTALRAGRDEIQRLINLSENSSNADSAAIFDELSHIICERNRMNFEAQMTAITERIKDEDVLSSEEYEGTEAGTSSKRELIFTKQHKGPPAKDATPQKATKPDAPKSDSPS